MTDRLRNCNSVQNFVEIFGLLSFNSSKYPNRMNRLTNTIRKTLNENNRKKIDSYFFFVAQTDGQFVGSFKNRIGQSNSTNKPY